ncbi:MAG: C40 family peptidase [Vulcanimicrobiota bacterium]
MAIYGLGGYPGLNPYGMGPQALPMMGIPLQQILMALVQQMLAQFTGGSGFAASQNPGFGGGSGGCGCGGGSPSNFVPNAQGGLSDFLGGTRPNSQAGSELPASSTGNRLADFAKRWDGKNFKPGQTKRCADFVSTMLEQSGTAPPGFKHTARAADFAKYGKKVGRDALKPGDIVLFDNTYRRGKYTHVGIYIGNGKFVHRPTANAPVKIDSLTSGRYAQKFSEGRRL